jgi:hypothetical protein
MILGFALWATLQNMVQHYEKNFRIWFSAMGCTALSGSAIWGPHRRVWFSTMGHTAQHGSVLWVTPQNLFSTMGHTAEPGSALWAALQNLVENYGHSKWQQAPQAWLVWSRGGSSTMLLEELLMYSTYINARVRMYCSPLELLLSSCLPSLALTGCALCSCAYCAGLILSLGSINIVR